MGHGFIVHTNVEDAKKLKTLGPSTCIIQTQADSMRGVDYRSTDGISLLIAKPLQSKRAYEQALGRVGRYDEKCKRYLLDRVNKYDEMQELQIIGRIRS